MPGRHAFDLYEVLRELHGSWRTTVQAKGLDFGMKVEADVPRIVTLDPLRLKQILINLLSNACKFTTQGRISLHVARDADRLRFSVSDTGPGMPREMQTLLLRPFVALNDAHAHAASQPGPPLGLLLSRKLAQQMGGDLVVSSTARVGTEVVLQVPVRTGPPVDAPDFG